MTYSSEVVNKGLQALLVGSNQPSSILSASKSYPEFLRDRDVA